MCKDDIYKDDIDIYDIDIGDIDEMLPSLRSRLVIGHVAFALLQPLLQHLLQPLLQAAFIARFLTMMYNVIIFPHNIL